MGTDWGQKRYCDILKQEVGMAPFWMLMCCSYMNTKSHCGVCLLSLFPAPSFFVLVETAVNIGYSCKLLDPDTRLLEWQELRLAMIEILRDTHAHTYTISLIFVCLPLQTDTPVPRPRGQFLEGQTDRAVDCRQGDGWSKDCYGPYWTWAGKHWTYRKYEILI